jgi:hypothetical protein
MPRVPPGVPTMLYCPHCGESRRSAETFRSGERMAVSQCALRCWATSPAWGCSAADAERPSKPAIAAPRSRPASLWIPCGSPGCPGPGRVKVPRAMVIGGLAHPRRRHGDDQSVRGPHEPRHAPTCTTDRGPKLVTPLPESNTFRASPSSTRSTTARHEGAQPAECLWTRIGSSTLSVRARESLNQLIDHCLGLASGLAGSDQGH